VAKRVTAKQVNEAGGEYARMSARYGEHDQGVQRAYIRFLELKSLWQQQNPGRVFGKTKRNPAAHAPAPTPEQIKRGVGRSTRTAERAVLHTDADGAVVWLLWADAAQVWEFDTQSDALAFLRRAGFDPERRASNPVPASSALGPTRSQVLAAARLREDFTGHTPRMKDIVKMPKPRYPDAAMVVGELDGLLYTTVRDGKVESYIHRFRQRSRPLLCVSPDGKTLFMLGGAYSFTERGIVDE
jgi:hypothetical protein